MVVLLGCLATSHLYHRSESLALRLPGVLFSFLLLSDLLLDYCSLLHELQLVLLDYSLVHGVELFSLALKHLFADFLVSLDAVRVEGSPATSSAFNELVGIVFWDLEFTLLLELTYRFFFRNICSVPLRRWPWNILHRRVVVYWLGSLPLLVLGVALSVVVAGVACSIFIIFLRLYWLLFRFAVVGRGGF